MSITTKLQEIIAIQKNNSDAPIGTLNSPVSNNAIEKIELLLEEELPTEIKELYALANGQKEDGNGILFGEKFCSTEEILQQLEFSRTLLKPKSNSLANPEKSEKLIKEIVDFYVGRAPKHKLFGLQKSWYKMEFAYGTDSSEGPYLYATESTADRERKILDIDFEEQDQIFEIVNELHKLEKPTYKWDELKFVIYSNGKYEVERSGYNFDNEISFTSNPKNAIQKKYFHYKWLPVFLDYGGNYLGIDLDPAAKGTKGQVINFGRDEEDMFVFAETMESLFDKILTELNTPENRLLNPEAHLHETLKEITKK